MSDLTSLPQALQVTSSLSLPKARAVLSSPTSTGQVSDLWARPRVSLYDGGGGRSSSFLVILQLQTDWASSEWVCLSLLCKHQLLIAYLHMIYVALHHDNTKNTEVLHTLYSATNLAKGSVVPYLLILNVDHWCFITVYTYIFIMHILKLFIFFFQF